MSLDPCVEETRNNERRKDLYLESSSLLDIKPLFCGEEQCKSGHTFGPCIRSYYLLHYVTSGKGSYIVGGKHHDLKRGDIFIIRPNEFTTYVADIDDPWCYRWVGFTSKLELQCFASTDVISLPESDYLFRMMLNLDQRSEGKEFYICAKIFELLSLIERNSSSEIDVCRYIDAAINFIETNYSSSEITIALIADNLKLNRSYFSTLFKKETGKSPQKYLTDYRLNKAKEMLSLHSLLTHEIARACGYKDQYNFSKMFKKKFGVCPTHSEKIERN
jgi:AraC-like DNA-binding protein